MAWLCLLLLILDPLAGRWLPMPSISLGALGSDTIVLCTPEGMTAVDHDGKPVSLPDGSTHRLCTLCLPVLQGGALPTTLAAHEPPLRTSIQIDTSNRTPALTPPRPATAAIPRAPPAA